MLKKAVRLGILMVLVISFMFTPLSSKPARAISTATTWDVQADIFDQHWDGTTRYVDIFDTFTPVDWMEWTDLSPDVSIGDFRAMIESELGYPVTILAVLTNQYCGPEDAYVVQTSDGAKIGNYQVCEGDPWSYFLIFKASSRSENVRLTLFGYVLDDGKSCVLWSLDGSHPNNVNKTCGGEAKLVCKVKLVDKKLKYDCEGGYDWLGERIIHDPQWLSWADKFASMNGRK
jgi:hypothetical protein